MKRIGIIICERYRIVEGESVSAHYDLERVGAFSLYPADEAWRLVGYSSCGGCPGGNVEYVQPSSKGTAPRSFIWPPGWSWVTPMSKHSALQGIHRKRI
jgi:hypothetical protein